MIARPKEMSAVWGTIKAQVMFQKWEWEKQSAPLVQSPTIDSWLNPKQSVSIKEVAIALHGIQSPLPAALQSGQELLSAAVPMLSESVIDGVEDVEVERVIRQVDSGDKGKAAAMATIRATLSRFNLPGNKRKFGV